jgi:hypothetical protein
MHIALPPATSRVNSFLTVLRPIFSTLLVCSPLAWAQTTPLPAAGNGSNTTSASVNQPASKTNQLIEHISIEDGATRIDEMRFGGQTKSITVQPKGGMPAYDVQPETGVRTWKIFGY